MHVVLTSCRKTVRLLQEVNRNNNVYCLILQCHYNPKLSCRFNPRNGICQKLLPKEMASRGSDVMTVLVQFGVLGVLLLMHSLSLVWLQSGTVPTRESSCGDSIRAGTRISRSKPPEQPRTVSHFVASKMLLRHRKAAEAAGSVPVSRIVSKGLDKLVATRCTKPQMGWTLGMRGGS